MQPLTLVALPAFDDNYIWMLHDGVRAVVVDPGDAAPVRHALERGSLELAGILVTHHHGDHVGGIDALRPLLAGEVHGPAGETIPEPFVRHREGDAIDLLGLRWRVLEVPGHTAGHVAYVATPAGQAPILLCGDTLFSGGCGRLFEGTPVQMHDSLGKFATLHGNTRVCCAHEYTLSNLKFAAAVEPGNARIAAYTRQCQARRADLEPTLPSTIATELEINPFMRVHVPEVVRSARAHGSVGDEPAQVLAALRAWKNDFR